MLSEQGHLTRPGFLSLAPLSKAKSRSTEHLGSPHSQQLYSCKRTLSSKDVSGVCSEKTLKELKKELGKLNKKELGKLNKRSVKNSEALLEEEEEKHHSCVKSKMYADAVPFSVKYAISTNTATMSSIPSSPVNSSSVADSDLLDQTLHNIRMKLVSCSSIIICS